MLRRFPVLILAVLLSATLWGCGSNRDSGSSEALTLEQQFGSDAAGRSFVGGGTCIGCHQDISFSAELVQGLLQSKHVVHEDHINAASPAECLLCHDPTGDGSTIAPLIAAENVPAEGLAAVTCEDCHGAGGEHFGVGPIPNVRPDFNTCGTCHRGLPQDQHDHLGALANNILQNFLDSAALDTGHAASFSDKNFPGRIEGTSMMTADCARCHTDEGFQQLFAINTGFGEMVRELGNVGPFENVSVVQCRTCHDPHDLGLKGEGATFLNVSATPGVFDFRAAYSAEFNLCTGCHQAFLVPNAFVDASTFFDPVTGTFNYTLDPTVYDSASPDVGALTEVHNPATGALLNPADPTDRAITDTHFAAADDGSGNVVVGYNINAADETPCTVCHDPHASSKFPATAAALAAQWAASGHADYPAEPFTRDFSSDSSRECMKCHNGSEYAKFVNGVEPDGLDNSQGARVIACVACHDLQAKDAAGAFVLGPLRSVDEVAFPSGAVQSIPDGSNLCMECHQGRESGLTVVNAIAENPAGPHRFINRHYFAAAAIFFGSEVTAGFEYPGRTYLGRNVFAGHQGNNRQTCRECHLRGAAGEVIHDFAPDPVLLPFCAQCHTDAPDNLGPAGGGTLTDFNLLGLPFGVANVDYDGDGANLPPTVVGGIGESFQQEIDGFAGDGVNTPEGGLLTAIKSYAANTLGASIVYAPGSYPYWFNDLNGNGIADDTADPATDEVDRANGFTSFDARLLQAAYNFHSAQDPCSDIHNYRYVLQTLYDSIDDLDDGALNSSVQFNAAAAIRP
jgi:hypothetical protein